MNQEWLCWQVPAAMYPTNQKLKRVSCMNPGVIRQKNMVMSSVVHKTKNDCWQGPAAICPTEWISTEVLKRVPVTGGCYQAMNTESTADWKVQ